MMMTDGNEPCVDFLRFTIAAYRSKETDIDEVAPVTELPRIILRLDELRRIECSQEPLFNLVATAISWFKLYAVCRSALSIVIRGRQRELTAGDGAF